MFRPPHMPTTLKLVWCLLYLCQQLVRHCLRKFCLAVFCFLEDPVTGRTGWMQSATARSPTLSTLKLKLHMFRSHYVLLCGPVHIRLQEQYEHNPQEVFCWKTERWRWGGMLGKLQKPRTDNPTTLRKPKSVFSFILETKAVDKSWANFAESLRREIKKKHKKTRCISYSKWTFHMRIDWTWSPSKYHINYSVLKVPPVPRRSESCCEHLNQRRSSPSPVRRCWDSCTVSLTRSRPTWASAPHPVQM